MTRHRLEDLGRLAEKLRQLVDRDDWQRIPGRKKDLPEFVAGLPEDERHGFLYELGMSMGAIEDCVYECLSIAEARDLLNEDDDGD